MVQICSVDVIDGLRCPCVLPVTHPDVLGVTDGRPGIRDIGNGIAGNWLEIQLVLVYRTSLLNHPGRVGVRRGASRGEWGRRALGRRVSSGT